MSDRSLDELISSLKSEAIDAAEKESKRILEEAHLQAQRTLKEAEDKKTRILKDAEQEAKAIINKGESALRQAARDLNIEVRNNMLNLFEVVLEKEIRKEFTPDLIKSTIVKVIENVGKGVELKLSKELEEELADYIHKRVQSSDDLISIAQDRNMLTGLSVIKKEQGWSYRISPEEITELLNSYLIGKWVRILANEE